MEAPSSAYRMSTESGLWQPSQHAQAPACCCLLPYLGQLVVSRAGCMLLGVLTCSRDLQQQAAQCRVMHALDAWTFSMRTPQLQLPSALPD